MHHSTQNRTKCNVERLVLPPCRVNTVVKTGFPAAEDFVQF